MHVIRTERIVIKVLDNTDEELKNFDVFESKVSGLKDPIFLGTLVIPEIEIL